MMNINLKKTTFKNGILASSILGLTAMLSSFAVSSYAQNNSFESLSKELEIMKSVLTTAFKQASEKQTVKVRHLETNYLAGQGVIYNIDVSTRNSWFVGIHEGGRFPAIPAQPLAPISPGANDLLGVSDASVLEQALVQSSVNSIEGLSSDHHQTLRETQSEARNLALKMREYAREMRDVKFEMAQVASQERQKELQESLNELENQNVALNEQKTKLMTAARELAEKSALKRKEQKEALAKANTEFLSDFEMNIADNLCRFGAGLRALPNNEHITFVLDDFNSAIKPDTKDRIYVFTAADVKRCVQEKIDTSALLASAVVYDF